MQAKLQLKSLTVASGKSAVAWGMGVLATLEGTAHRGPACGATVVVLPVSLWSLVLQASYQLCDYPITFT